MELGRLGAELEQEDVRERMSGAENGDAIGARGACQLGSLISAIAFLR
jgi:hypothetical protein